MIANLLSLVVYLGNTHFSNVYLEYVTDWLMDRFARRIEKLWKAETSRNTNSRNKRRDWDVCSQV